MGSVPIYVVDSIGLVGTSALAQALSSCEAGGFSFVRLSLPRQAIYTGRILARKMGEMGSVPIYVVDSIGPNARRLPFSLEGIYTGRIWGRKGGEMRGVKWVCPP